MGPTGMNARVHEMSRAVWHGMNIFGLVVVLTFRSRPRRARKVLQRCPCISSFRSLLSGAGRRG